MCEILEFFFDVLIRVFKENLGIELTFLFYHYVELFLLVLLCMINHTLGSSMYDTVNIQSCHMKQRCRYARYCHIGLAFFAICSLFWYFLDIILLLATG